MTSLIDEIRSRGHWHVVIRPETWDPTRMGDFSALWPIIENASVEIRGWDFPHVNPNKPPDLGNDWIGIETEWENILEVWRFFMSGQFVHLSGVTEDWRDRSTWFPAPEGWAPGATIGIANVLYRLTEVFEFAARLTLAWTTDDAVRIEVSLRGVTGRQLIVDEPERLPFRQPRITQAQSLPYTASLTRSQLVSAAHSAALDGAHEIFKRFGWNPERQLLRDWQGKIRELR